MIVFSYYSTIATAHLFTNLVTRQYSHILDYFYSRMEIMRNIVSHKVVEVMDVIPYLKYR